MSYLYSSSTNGFYLSDAHIDIPKDAVEITDELYESLFAGQNSGKSICSDLNGYPILIDQPAPTKIQLVSIANSQKAAFIAEATVAIAPLQDAVDLDEATAEESENLKLWKQYRVSVNRVDTSTAPDITWPNLPL